jgi:hypothetical protein
VWVLILSHTHTTLPAKLDKTLIMRIVLKKQRKKDITFLFGKPTKSFGILVPDL